MGKHSKNKNSSTYNHKSSWFATMFHILDFHYWRTKNHPICWKTPRTRSSSMRETDEQEPFLDSNPTRQETNKMITTKQVTEYVDFLEILKREDVFVKILKDPKFGKQVEIKSNPRVLPKSSTFPLSNSSPPARIDHKQRENWYKPKQNVAVLTLNVPKESRAPSHAVIKGFREIKKLIKNVLQDLKHTKKKKSKFSDVSNVGRYSQLLEQSFRRSGGELSSRSLRLSCEDTRDDKPQFFRRVSSLSRLEVLGSFLNDMSHDCSSRKSVDLDTNLESKKSFLLSESVVRTEKEEENDEEQEERSKEDYLDSPNDKILQQDQDSVPKTGFLDNTAHETETVLSRAKWLDLKPIEIYTNEEEDYFSYVHKILEVSGFLENKDNIEQWYSEEQPLNPSILYELEETVNGELLFDLVNEAIAETHYQSYMYFPKPFSFEKRFLDEVWRRVEWSLTGLEDENRDVSLDDIVGRDVSRGDGWMNLCGEHEWISLELEDMIFDEVLDEFVICVYS